MPVTELPRVITPNPSFRKTRTALHRIKATPSLMTGVAAVDPVGDQDVLGALMYPFRR